MKFRKIISDLAIDKSYGSDNLSPKTLIDNKFNVKTKIIAYQALFQSQLNDLALIYS